MKILSIETSCDDTAISIFEVSGGVTNASFKVLANNLNSQINIHIPYGGVYPVLAKREHAKNLPIVFGACLKQAHLTPNPSPKEREKPYPLGRVGRGKLNKSPVDVIAVTYGPGLEMCLWEGISFAKDLAKKWNIPLIPVNHMEGHILSVFGKSKGKFEIPLRRQGSGGQAKIKIPILSLLVSGGHTQLVLIKKPASTRTSLSGWMDYKIIGETLDDAVGEAFDKVARMLELPYPGGPQISKLAEEERKHLAPLLNKEGVGGGNSKNHHLAPTLGRSTPPQKGGEKIDLPRPMLHSQDFNFSFSGLKTAVFYLIRDLTKKDPNILQNEKMKKAIALEFENAAIECLVYKTKKAMEKYGAKTLIVAGGVACNTHLQREMKKALGHAKGRAGKKIKLLFPAKGLVGDNSLMIGIAGYLNYIKNKRKVPKLDSLKATGNLSL